MVVLSPTLEKDSQREVTMTLGWSQVTGFPGVVKNLPAKQETWVQSLGQEDHLEKEMATHSSVLAWRILWTGAWWAAWGPKGLEGKGEKERYTH